ncbi:MAG: transcriptional repressor [Deltaproteobacteria bacterium RBG_16_48_10]|nr:MAG: transcriptional repressor [Deltaproteobacteria bacterium RBG_16_48_10]
MAIPENRLNKMITRLKEQGFRLTPQRMAVVKILASNDEHLSAEKIFERVKNDFPFTSLATIYKTVTLLKNIGEVMELGFVDHSNRYDGIRPYPHPHLICLKCRKILDPDISTLSELPEELAQKTGYHILNHRLDFFGICPQCQKKDEVPRSRAAGYSGIF